MRVKQASSNGTDLFRSRGNQWHLELDRIVVSKFLRGLDDEQVFDVSKLALYAGNNIGPTAGDTESLMRVDLPGTKSSSFVWLLHRVISDLVPLSAV